ncbi:MAG: type VI secretion system-associated protein TagF [Pseudomonadota bacterium]
MVGSVSADSVIRGAIDCPAIIGKLPAHGDFIARGIDYSAREPLDRWMSSWVELAREQLGNGFDEAYETAAPWLIEGPRCNAVLMPSVDAVGRVFPVLAVSDATCHIQAIYDALIEALGQGVTVDVLREALGRAGDDGEVSEQPESLGDWFLPDGAEKALPSPSEAPGWAQIRVHLA